MVDKSVWRDKDIRIARQSAIKAGVNLLDVGERMGLVNSGNVSSLQELCDLHDKLVDRLFDKIYKDML